MHGHPTRCGAGATVAGKFHHVSGRSGCRARWLDESLATFRNLGDRVKIVEVRCILGLLFQVQGAFAQSSAHLEASLRLGPGNRGCAAQSPGASTSWGCWPIRKAAPQASGRVWNDSLIGCRATGNTVGHRTQLREPLAMVALDRGDAGRAGAYLVESVTLLRDLGERRDPRGARRVCTVGSATGRQPTDAQAKACSRPACVARSRCSANGSELRGGCTTRIRIVTSAR